MSHDTNKSRIRPPEAAKYRALIDAADSHASHLIDLGNKPHFSALKNSKGKLSLKDVKDRIKSLDTAPGDADGAETERTEDEKKARKKECAALADYVSTDKKQKEATKSARELFEAVQSKFMERLEQVPLHDSLRDLEVIVRFLKSLDQQSTLKARIREADEALDQLAYDKYPELTEAEIKTLVVDDKWLTTLAAAVQGELDRVSQTLTTRIRLLAERYAAPLPQIVDEVAALSARVDGHLKKMGVRT